MNDMEATKTPLLTQVRSMAVGEVITVSLADHNYGYVRNCAFVASLDLARNFSTRLNREARTCTITRNS